ncbi:MAG: ATP-binding cassette domain-containing protein [Lachnospiraceae bacterium]|nr:ATP-binding cassette domain-containing protein [Lachnospiraceae bacterium]
MHQEDFILQMRNVTKKFPGVIALSDINLDISRGKVHAIVGENGAGKSTLIKIISAVYPYGQYDGEYIYNGKELKLHGIRDADKAGIACIHQELNLVMDMSVMENIFLNEKPTKYGFIDFDQMYAETEVLLKQIGMDGLINPEEKIRNLGIGQKQMVEIARALAKEVAFLVLDEPTAALTEAEVDILLGIVEMLRNKGVTCVYISHRLDEVMRISDEITVLRDGEKIETRKRADMSKDNMIQLMVGRALSNLFPRVVHTRGEKVFEVRNYSVSHPDISGKKLIDNVSFDVFQGEVLGFSGLMGAGRTELFTAIYGAFREKGKGEVYLKGVPFKVKSVTEALEQGYVIISEDRKRYGLNLRMDIKENTTLAALRKISSRLGFLNEDEEVKVTRAYIESIRIVTPGVDTCVANLSGGNQQKVVLAKALFCEPKIVIFDEPTRGIDVGAKYEIYKLINDLVDKGVAVVMISSEMEEILGMSDRVLVMADGRITGEFDISEANQEVLMTASVPGGSGDALERSKYKLEER